MSTKTIILLLLSVLMLGGIVSCHKSTEVPPETFARNLTVTKKAVSPSEPETILLTALPNGSVRYLHYSILAPIELIGTPRLEISRDGHKITLKEVFVGNSDVNGMATYTIQAEMGSFDVGHLYQLVLLNHAGKKIADLEFRYGAVLELLYEFPERQTYLRSSLGQ